MVLVGQGTPRKTAGVNSKWILVAFVVGYIVANEHAKAQYDTQPQLMALMTTSVVATDKQPPPSYLDLHPATKTVVINIGSNVDPVLPKPSSGPCAVTLAFEPIVPGQVRRHPQVHVVPAAVAGSAYLASMYAYNHGGASSSLSKVAGESDWNTGERKGGMKIVPVVSMQNVLDAIPPHATIEFLKTDTQGYDFQIISSSIQELKNRGVKLLMTEVNFDNAVSYQGVQNDFCLHWLPFMTSPEGGNNAYTLMGFFVGGYNKDGFLSAQDGMARCQKAAKTEQTYGQEEADALWKLSSLPKDTHTNSEIQAEFDFAVVRAPKKPKRGKENEKLIFPKNKVFSDKEYEACRKQT